MVVKEKRGRRRYVLFDTGREFDKESLIRELRKVCPENTPFVIQTASNFAILRCAPDECENVVKIMSEAIPESRSVTTSGTLATIRKRFPVLKVSRARA